MQLLFQHIRYKGKGGKSLHEKKEVAGISRGEVMPGSTDVWREELAIPSQLPPSGLQGCTLIELWYTLKVTKKSIFTHNGDKKGVNSVHDRKALKKLLVGEQRESCKQSPSAGAHDRRNRLFRVVALFFPQRKIIF